MKRAKKEECDERDYSIKLTLPALGVVIMTCTPEEEKKPVKATQAKKAAVKKTAVKKTATKTTAAKKTTAIKKKLSEGIYKLKYRRHYSYRFCNCNAFFSDAVLR